MQRPESELTNLRAGGNSVGKKPVPKRGAAPENVRKLDWAYANDVDNIPRNSKEDGGGLVENRSWCSDWPCCCLFWVIMLLMFTVWVDGWEHGDPYLLVRPYD